MNIAFSWASLTHKRGLNLIITRKWGGEVIKGRSMLIPPYFQGLVKNKVFGTFALISITLWAILLLRVDTLSLKI